MSIVLYETRERVAIITLNRPDQRNAQNAPLLEELDKAFDRAMSDDDVRVVVLNAAGKHFSAGHDISPEVLTYEPWKSMFSDVEENGLLRMYNWEKKHFLGYARKWRDLPKPTIASVQGACVAAGLMLVWPMDLIVAADNARFSDPVVRMGTGGVEYHGHTWEFGARKAKELLFTAGFIDAHEAQRLGMVNRVVPLEELESATLKLAAEIAQMHPHPLQMAKRAVNQTLDVIGQYAAIQSVFDIHSLGHANAWATCGQATIAGLAEMAPANKAKQER
ncbi:Enoyl-CoA hydratase/isomerase [Burkholderia sp. H160]|nr:Enoyl-CoA hydratase/isomerase [Burkholderia sp. H160]